jgi:hypothetical protein
MFRKAVKKAVGGEAIREAILAEAKNNPGGDQGETAVARQLYKKMSDHWDKTIGVCLAKDRLAPHPPSAVMTANILRETKRICDMWGVESPEPEVEVAILSLIYASMKHRGFAIRVTGFIHEEAGDIRPYCPFQVEEDS